MCVTHALPPTTAVSEAIEAAKKALMEHGQTIVCRSEHTLYDCEHMVLD